MPRFNSQQTFDFYFGQSLQPENEYNGATMLFAMSSPPPGWTKVTTYNDYALRITNGTPGTGGSTAFSTVFTTQPVFNGGNYATGPYPITVAPHTISVAEMVTHDHTWGPGAYLGPALTSSSSGSPYSAPFNPGAPSWTGVGGYFYGIGNPSPYVNYLGEATDSNGIGGGHVHTATVSGVSLSLSVNFNVKYVDTILATYVV